MYGLDENEWSDTDRTYQDWPDIDWSDADTDWHDDNCDWHFKECEENEFWMFFRQIFEETVVISDEGWDTYPSSYTGVIHDSPILPALLVRQTAQNFDQSAEKVDYSELGMTYYTQLESISLRCPDWSDDSLYGSDNSHPCDSDCHNDDIDSNIAEPANSVIAETDHNVNDDGGWESYILCNPQLQWNGKPEVKSVEELEYEKEKFHISHGYPGHPTLGTVKDSSFGPKYE